MAHATIAVVILGLEGLFWNRFLLAVSACFSRILLKEPLLTLCKEEIYFTLFARYSHVLQWAFCHC